MTINAGLKPEGAPARSLIAGAGASSGVDPGPKRYSVQRKMAVVARLLRGANRWMSSPGRRMSLWPSSSNGGSERSPANEGAT
jgi:hypothetical protein